MLMPMGIAWVFKAIIYDDELFIIIYWWEMGSSPVRFMSKLFFLENYEVIENMNI